jgi:hypothetical protein
MLNVTDYEVVAIRCDGQQIDSPARCFIGSRSASIHSTAVGVYMTIMSSRNCSLGRMVSCNRSALAQRSRLRF